MIGWTLGGVNQTITDSGLFQSGLILQAGRKRSDKGSHIAQLTKKNNWINAKYRQIAFQLARWGCSRAFFSEPLVKQK